MTQLARVFTTAVCITGGEVTSRQLGGCTGGRRLEKSHTVTATFLSSTLRACQIKSVLYVVATVDGLIVSISLKIRS